ncbi:MAG: hypothetical protein AAGF89_15690 [Bacteroidota bacterium]
MTPKNTTLLTFLLCLCTSLAFAQSALIELPAPNLTKLEQEDQLRPLQRFSAPIPLDVSPSLADDAYTYANGAMNWSRTFRVPGTSGLALFLEDLHLPADGSISLHNDQGSRGPFTQADASEKNRLFTGFLPGETVTITYRGSLPDTVPFRLWRLDHVFRPDLWEGGTGKDFGDSNACQINANCPAGDGWEDEKSGAARINLVVVEGVGFCSGSLINNTAQDGRPYVLTGFHCMDGFTPLYDLWTLDFGYTSTDCNNPTTEPTPTTYTGVEFRAGRRDNDFLLLEIIDVDFAAEDHYFAGWDRSDGDVNGVVRHFHHPQGDIQKTSTSGPNGMDILPGPIQWTNDLITPAGHHFEVDLTLGSFEIGSSGSAFFDENRRIRGQLSGGRPSCDGAENVGFVGRLHLSWDAESADSARLAPWLDPLGTNPMTLDGANLVSKRFVSGQVLTEGGNPAVGATITFQWENGGRQDYTVDAQGNFRGERPPTVTTFAISGSYKADAPLDEGVDVGDIITIRRQILGLADMTPLAQIAGDVNNSGTIRVSDITRITRVILGIGDWGSRPNWLVLPVGFPINPTPVDPQSPIGIALNNAGVFELPVDFLVVKTGDADLNVD